MASTAEAPAPTHAQATAPAEAAREAAAETAVVLDGKGLTIEKVVSVARHGARVELSPAAVERIRRCRAMLEAKLRSNEPIYGVNTGIGEFSEVSLTEQQVRDFQRYLIYNHAAGIGEPCPAEHVRAAMMTRANVHAHGHSACRLEITETLIAMLNAGVTPVVCEKGSVGACGDLAPMSQIALLCLGEGEAFFRGERLPGRAALDRAGIAVPGLQARDGLALINGANVVTGMSALLLHDAQRLILHAEIAAAMSLEALLANLKPYDRRVHELRGFAGAIRSSGVISRMIDGSDLCTGKMKTKVQDAYSMRSTPQVIGAARDALVHARTQVEIELNGVGDNPLFLPDDDLVLTGANFQATPVSLPMDMVGSAVTMVCVLSERRMNRLNNTALSVGLPPFLTKKAGMFSGLMLSQYTADTLIVEQRILSMPAFVQSIPAAADQEDFVSMGMNTALKNVQILENAYGIVGIEFMAAAQALDIRGFTPGAGVAAAHRAVRTAVEFLDVDRPLHTDHNAMRRLVKSGLIIEEVERAIGKLA